MVDIMDANVEKMYDLNGVHQVVVQKGNIGGSYIYALQLLNKGTDTVVYRARKGADFKKGARAQRVYLDGVHTKNINPKQTAGGHRQTCMQVQLIEVMVKDYGLQVLRINIMQMIRFKSSW